MNIPLSLLYNKVKYSIQYVDSLGWTVPVMLTAERAERALSDISVSKIRLYRARATPICTIDLNAERAKEEFQKHLADTFKANTKFY